MNHIGDTNKMVSDTPRTDAAIGNSQDRSWMDGTLCRQLERELNAANERIKRLEEAGDALMEIVEGARFLFAKPKGPNGRRPSREC